MTTKVFAEDSITNSMSLMETAGYAETHGLPILVNTKLQTENMLLEQLQQLTTKDKQ